MATDHHFAYSLDEAAYQLPGLLIRNGITLEQWNKFWAPEAVARRRAQPEPRQHVAPAAPEAAAPGATRSTGWSDWPAMPAPATDR
jgi:hypothetical protein